MLELIRKSGCWLEVKHGKSGDALFAQLKLVNDNIIILVDDKERNFDINPNRKHK